MARRCPRFALTLGRRLAEPELRSGERGVRPYRPFGGTSLAAATRSIRSGTPQLRRCASVSVDSVHPVRAAPCGASRAPPCPGTGDPAHGDGPAEQLGTRRYALSCQALVGNALYGPDSVAVDLVVARCSSGCRISP
jgi:hypothetical protein